MSNVEQPDDGPEHYFSAQPTSTDRERTVSFDVDGRSYELVASAGVFSGSRLDPGTNVLLGKVTPPDGGGTYLDLGCGYGPITAVLAENPQAQVWAVDVNERALDLTRRNTSDSEGTVYVRSVDEVPAEVRFDEIWSNPPIKIGKESLHRLLSEWLPRLRPNGVAWLVVSKHLGGDSLAKWLASEGWAVDKHASAKGYRVLRVSRD
ncbi:class I SAM-dependent methyltransferase [Haloglycomyces albus]|uniref:class I SAM-dependent methyltransferase n=1 Tax=Haloglycomyces albus TaxID=526067 RepID=UPI0004A3B13A|nr:methyltransferase [Haloglycomyces albus]